MATRNSLPAYGTLEDALAVLFVNDSSAPTQIRLLKLTNNSSTERILHIYLNSGGVRTPLLPESFGLKPGHMASDDITLMLRKSDAIEGMADVAQSVSYILS